MMNVSEALTYMLAFDIGTEYVSMWERSKGLVELTPSGTTREEKCTMSTAMARRIDKNNKVIAVGRDALQLRGRSLQTRVEVIQPYEDGAIRPTDDGQAAVRHLMEYGLEMAYGKFDAKRRTYSRLTRIQHPSILTAITHTALETERQSTEETIRSLNCLPRIVGQPTASAIGADLPIDQARAVCLVDLGGGTAGITVIYQMNIAAPPQDFKIGGRKINRAIMEGVRKDFQMEIGEPTAEFLKRNVLSFESMGYVPSKTVKAKPLNGGKPEPITITKEHMVSWVKPLLIEHLVQPLTHYLETLNPELYEDIHSYGIDMAGGTSLTKGLPTLLKDEIGIEFRLVPDPLFSLIIGLGKMIENPKLLELAEQSLLSEAEKRKLGYWAVSSVPESSARLVRTETDDDATVIMPAPEFQG